MNRIVYIAHRLFAPHDRLLAALLADFLSKKFPETPLFLPFCDTDEDAFAHPEKGRLLYEKDRERLKKLALFIAFLHGPSYDEGVCMELGFAYALGAPTLVVTSDFISYGFEGDTEVFNLNDPLLELLSDRIIHLSEMPMPSNSLKSKYDNFAERNMATLDLMNERIYEAINLAPLNKEVTPPPDSDLVYIDFCGGEYAHYEPLVEQIIFKLQARGIRYYVAKRLQRDIPSTPRVAAEDDLKAASKASAYILGGSGSEVPAGAAAMVGFANALERPAYLYYGGRQLTYAAGREPNARNLMVLYGATKIIQSVSELEDTMLFTKS